MLALVDAVYPDGPATHKIQDLDCYFATPNTDLRFGIFVGQPRMMHSPKSSGRNGILTRSCSRTGTGVFVLRISILVFAFMPHSLLRRQRLFAALVEVVRIEKYLPHEKRI